MDPFLTALLTVGGSLAVGGGVAATAVASTVSLVRRITGRRDPKIEVAPEDIAAELDQMNAAAARDPDQAPSQPAAPSRPQSESGRKEALAVMRVYMRDLIEESSRIAARVGSDQASRDHVRLAASRIGIYRATTAVIIDLMLALGALLLGGPIAYQINLWTGGTAAGGATTYVVIAAAVIGVALMATAGALKWVRR